MKRENDFTPEHSSTQNEFMGGFIEALCRFETLFVIERERERTENSKKVDAFHDQIAVENYRLLQPFLSKFKEDTKFITYKCPGMKDLSIEKINDYMSSTCYPQYVFMLQGYIGLDHYEAPVIHFVIHDNKAIPIFYWNEETMMRVDEINRRSMTLMSHLAKNTLLTCTELYGNTEPTIVL